MDSLSLESIALLPSNTLTHKETFKTALCNAVVHGGLFPSASSQSYSLKTIIAENKFLLLTVTQMLLKT